MKSVKKFLLLTLFVYLWSWSYAQSDSMRVVLKTAEMTSEELSDTAEKTIQPKCEPSPLYIYILNDEVVSREQADDAVTLWSINSIKRLDCTKKLRGGAILKNTYLIFETQKRYRPHLEGNVAGYSWRSLIEKELEEDICARNHRERPAFIGSYVLRSDYDSVKLATGRKSVTAKDVKWRNLPRDVMYILNGNQINTDALKFLEGTIIKSLDYFSGDDVLAEYGEESINGVFVATTFPKRTPLIVFDGEPMTFAEWLKFCSGIHINMGTTLNYQFIPPVGAVERYGEKGIYGCIYVRSM